MNNKVFVTGGTGFVGSYICRFLVQKGYTPVVLKRSSSPLELLSPVLNKIEFHEGDIGDLLLLSDIMQEVNYVIHSAAVISFVKKERDRMFEVNVNGTRAMVNMAMQSDIKKFIHISSVAAFGKSKFERHIDENSKWIDDKMNTLYGLSKYLAEREIYRAKAEGLNATIISPSFVIGGSFWNQGTPAIIDTIANGLSFFPPASNGVVDVRDVAMLAVKALSQETSGEKFIANGHNVKMKDFISKIAVGLGKKPPTRELNSFLVNVASASDYFKSVLTGSSRLITRESLKGTFVNMIYSNDKSRSILNHEYIPLDKSIDEICKKFRESQQLNQNYGLLEFE